MTESTQIKVWDPLVRFFHWALVSAFIIAYITEDDFLTIHSWAGYLILSLLCIRFVWGFIGTSYARFSDFAYSATNIIQFLKDTLRLSAKRYLGHNPAGGAMIFLLMFSLLITTTTPAFRATKVKYLSEQKTPREGEGSRRGQVGGFISFFFGF